MAPVRSQPNRQTHDAGPYRLRRAAILQPAPTVLEGSSPLSSPSESGSESPAAPCPTSPISIEEIQSLKADVELTKKKILQIADFLEGELKSSRQETERAKRVKAEAVERKNNAEAALDSLQTIINNFVKTRDEATKCAICASSTPRPFSLCECGHTFCYTCLRGWFHSCLERQVQYREVPEHLRRAPYTAEGLRKLFVHGHIYVTSYTCPLCRIAVRSRPFEVYMFKELIQLSNDSFGAPVDVAETHPNLRNHDIWADVFYKPRN